MGYGARARRVPARGGGQLTDVDMYKLGVVGRTERGFEDVLHTEIYSMGDYEIKCGLYGDGSDYIAYVVRSFFKELELSNPVEVKVLGYVAADAVQATYPMMDQDGTPEKLWDINAGRKNVADKSAFGNKIAVQVTTSTNETAKLAANILALATTCVLDKVDHLEVGNYIQFADGTNTEVVVVATVVPATKTVTFAALTNPYTAALTTVSRIDVELKVAVKNPSGNYEEKESWVGPMALSSTIGIAGLVNDEADGSDYIIMAHNAANATADPADQIPADLSAWTALTTGSDGTGPGDSDWNSLMTSFTDDNISILLSPESTSIDHNTNMATWATANYKCMYYAQAANKASQATLKNFGASLRKSVTFAMLPSDKWIETDDPITGGKVSIPKVGVDAAFWFNTYAKYGESKVAAGNKSELVLKCTDRLIDDNGLVHNDILGVGDRLIRSYSVNICRFRRGIGITNNSARTFSTDDGYKYQNQIMQWILYKKSIVYYLTSIEQDKAGIRAQESHYNRVWAYMKAKFDAGHIYQGRKEDGSLTQFSDACIIVNDFSMNTMANIANGIEEIFLQFIAPPPIEEPILSLASAAVTTIKA